MREGGEGERRGKGERGGIKTYITHLILDLFGCFHHELNSGPIPGLRPFFASNSECIELK